MVDIFSKSENPRREDAEAKRLLQGNRQTIHRLADQISNGEFSRSRARMAQAKQEPKPDGLNIHILGGSSAIKEIKPAVRISLNDRVFVMDENSGKQLEFLGQIKTGNGVEFFCLATQENGFISPVSPETEEVLQDLNGIVIETDEIKQKLAEVIATRLSL